MLRKAMFTALGVVLLAAAPADARTDRYGHTSAADGALRDGCHNYRYHYVVDAPTHDWTLETFLRGPDGEHLAAGVFADNSDPEHGRPVFRFCDNSTEPGRFTIRARLHWYSGYDGHKVVYKRSHFRLHRVR